MGVDDDSIACTLDLPSVGLSGFEPPLGEEERAIQATVHRFAKELLRPIGRELDTMTAEQAIAPGSPYWTVFQEAAKLGLDPSFLAQFEPATRTGAAPCGWPPALLGPVRTCGHSVNRP
jgi:hypothetical protein